MEIEDRQRRVRIVNLAVLTGTVAAIVAGLAMLTFLTVQAAAQMSQDATRELLVRLVWLSTALLALALVLLFWLVIRLLQARFRPRKRRTETPYVDAWALAGQRFKLDDSEADQDDQEGSST